MSIETDKRERGRPRLQNPRSRQIDFRLTENQLKQVKIAASAQKVSVSEFVRSIIFNYINDEK